MPRAPVRRAARVAKGGKLSLDNEVQKFDTATDLNAKGDLQVRGLNQEVRKFETTADTIAKGDLEIRRNFADRVMILFAIANVGVLIGLGAVFVLDCVQLATGLTKPPDRIVDGHVIMALLGATTVQLGTVIYTITRAIFPTPAGHGAGGHAAGQ